MIVGLLAYASLIAFLRISGKRTLAKLNAFDLVVTVALGSTLSAILLQESVALAEGVTALGLLILLQFAVTSASVRWPLLARMVRSEPTLLVHRGTLLKGPMRPQRVTRGEVEGAVRQGGGRTAARRLFCRPGERRLAQRHPRPRLVRRGRSHHPARYRRPASSAESGRPVLTAAGHDPGPDRS